MAHRGFDLSHFELENDSTDLFGTGSFEFNIPETDLIDLDLGEYSM